ncbi:MAG: transglutaminase domain-containing protein [Flavobacteriales bacterium]
MKPIFKFILLICFLCFSTKSTSQEFSAIDTHLASLPTQNYSSIEQLHNQIINPRFNEEQKVYAIAKYITNTIAYGERARKPLNTVNSREGVCQDYAELFIALCELSNIENNYVTGDGKTSAQDIGFYSSNHAWNVVKVNGRYQIYDLTWAAGTYNNETKSFNKNFNAQYFNANPEDFISNHFPDNSKWQLLDIPLSKNDYINSPTFSPEFKNLSLKNGIVRSDNLEITFESDHDYDSCTLFKWKLNEYGTASGVDIPLTKEGQTYKLKLVEDIPGTYRYDITFWPSKKEDIQETNDDGSVSYTSTSSTTLEFKLITPNYKIPRPTTYDKKDPWGLIESYHYIFHRLDTAFFNELNPSSRINSINNLKNAGSLHNSLKNWIGDYKRYYTNLRNGDISYKINNFNIILGNNSDGYEFKEIKRRLVKKGSYGYAVTELQNYFELENTGYFDDLLEQKIKDFQALNNLKADGIVGSNTYKYLSL